jgi:RNA polymerase sigma-70 factor (ECF subfamily)
VSKETDLDLVLRARSGDNAAAGRLFVRYWRAARAAALAITADIAAAEDAASEGFMQAFAGLGTLQEPSLFAPWLKTIVVRQALSTHRRKHADIDDLGETADARRQPDDLLLTVELHSIVSRALVALPNRLREALLLFYMEGYDTDTAALFLNVPAGTFRRRLHDGRKQLRRAVEHLIEGRKPVDQTRKSALDEVKRSIDRADDGDSESLFKAMRGILVLRPPAAELVDPFLKRLQRAAIVEDRPVFEERARRIATRLTTPSDHALDPEHPLGRVSVAIKRALPHFEEWQLDFSSALRALEGGSGHVGFLRATLPPGFAEGREGAFVRGTRALLFQDGFCRTSYELVKDSQTARHFAAGFERVQAADVLDLTWMVAGVLELRSVQDLIEQLSEAVLPGIKACVTSYEEPRYRAALQLHFDGIPERAAVAGVLNAWPGRPEGRDAGHVRIYLNGWAGALTGQPIPPETMPYEPPPALDT